MSYVIQPAQLVRHGSWWSPSDLFSCSQLSAYAACPRAWAMRYLCGVKSAVVFRGAMLGTLIHYGLECYLRGGTVLDATFETCPADLKKQLNAWDTTEAKQRELFTEAHKRALITLPHMPPLHDIPERWIESQLEIDSRLVRPDIVEPIRLMGKIDLRYRRAALLYVQDHKSTKSWDYAPWVEAKAVYDAAPEAHVMGQGAPGWSEWNVAHDQLLADPQTVFYPLDTMFRFNVERVWCRWNYTLTDPKKHPQCKPYDFEVTRDELMPRAAYWYGVADEMRALVRYAKQGWRVDLDNWPLPPTLQRALANPAAYQAKEIDVQCDKYGGCVYRSAAGGPCAAPVPDNGSWIK